MSPASCLVEILHDRQLEQSADKLILVGRASVHPIGIVGFVDVRLVDRAADIGQHLGGSLVGVQTDGHVHLGRAVVDVGIRLAVPRRSEGVRRRTRREDLNDDVDRRRSRREAETNPGRCSCRLDCSACSSCRPGRCSGPASVVPVKAVSRRRLTSGKFALAETREIANAVVLGAAGVASHNDLVEERNRRYERLLGPPDS